MEDLIDKAKVLIEALPYIRRFYDKTIVVKRTGVPVSMKPSRDLWLDNLLDKAEPFIEPEPVESNHIWNENEISSPFRSVWIGTSKPFRWIYQSNGSR